MEDRKVSIIVPVYNTDKYLPKTIDSILNQTYQNTEIILINDGSTDRSGIICDKYKQKDSRIKVIHKKNSGVSATRNAGIDIATGYYIQFVDSDDYLELTMTESIVGFLENEVDLVICSYTAEFKNRKKNIIENHICPIEGIYKKSKFLMDFGELLNKRFINPIWNKLYITDIIKKNNVKFEEGLNMGEDLLFNINYLKICDCIRTSKENLYNYVNLNTNSLTASVKKDLFVNQQMLFGEVRQFLVEEDAFNTKTKDYIEMSYTDSIVRCFENLFHPNSELSMKDKRVKIHEIVHDDCVRKNIVHFFKKGTQKRFIGRLININSCWGIYIFFKMKTFLRNNLGPIFIILKKILEN